jgi:hypothetical protein
MPNFLVMDSTTGAGATCRAYSYANGTPTQIGNTFGNNQAHAGPNPTFSAGRNGCVQFAGDLYAQTEDGIYKKDDPSSMSGGWTIAHAWTQADSIYEQAFGLYVIGTSLYAIGGDSNAGANTLWWACFDGTSWTQAVSGQFVGTMTGVVDAIVYHDVLHLIGAFNGTTTQATFDAATTTFANKTAAWPSNRQLHSMCVFEDRLFAISEHNANNFGLYEYTGSWVLVESFDSDVGGASGPGSTGVTNIGKYGLFTDGTTLTALCLSNQFGYGFLGFEWDTSIVRTDISELGCIPAALRHSGVSGGTYSGTTNINNERMLPVYDLNSVVGTTDIYLYYAVNGTSGTSFTVYKWNGNTSVMTVVDSGGGNVYHAIPTGLPNYGERIFTAGELDIRILSRTGVVGGEEITFTVWGGGTGRKMKLHYTQEGTPQLLPATLALPVTGGSATLNTGSNQVEGIAADGTTVYTIVWDVQTDGLTTANRVARVPEALA